MSLDAKLRGITLPYGLKCIATGYVHRDDANEAEAQIKQAFTDEGYIHVPQVELVTRYERGQKPELFMVNGKEVMTGQEWYDKFEKELWTPPKIQVSMAQNDDGESHDRFFRASGENFMHDRALEAAKRAAGIKDAKA